MKLTPRKSEIIKNWLTTSDISEIASILGYTPDYVRKIINGQRNYNNAAGLEIIRTTVRKARINKSFRTQKAA